MEPPSLSDVSSPGRVADAGEGIGAEELALAARNHGMPLEALRYEVTPAGLHYVLVHYDIPVANDDEWRLTVGGTVRTPLRLGLAALRALPAVTTRVTMECAGNGRPGSRPGPSASPGWSRPWAAPMDGRASAGGARRGRGRA